MAASTTLRQMLRPDSVRQPPLQAAGSPRSPRAPDGDLAYTEGSPFLFTAPHGVFLSRDNCAHHLPEDYITLSFLTVTQLFIYIRLYFGMLDSQVKVS